MSSRRHRRWLVVGGVATALVIGVTVLVLTYFQPQKLFIDDHVNEAFPVAETGPSPEPTFSTSAPEAASVTSSRAVPTTPATTAVSEPVVEHGGAFISREHGTTGTATVYHLGDGRRVLRLEDLQTSNGPALVVYLSANPAHGPNGAFDDTYVDLGGLKGNIGSQNYEIPTDVDPGRYQSVVIWCDRFDVAFGAADLGGAAMG